MVGDGESAEGSIWESINFASHYKLDNLCVVFDINRLGQSEPTALAHDIDTYCKRLEAFGFETIPVDGHDVEALVKAFHIAASTKDKPTALVAKTFKGRNFPDVENLENWHGKPLGNKAEQALQVITRESRINDDLIIIIVAAFEEPNQECWTASIASAETFERRRTTRGYQQY